MLIRYGIPAALRLRRHCLRPMAASAEPHDRISAWPRHLDVGEALERMRICRPPLTYIRHFSALTGSETGNTLSVAP